MPVSSNVGPLITVAVFRCVPSSSYAWMVPTDVCERQTYMTTRSGGTADVAVIVEVDTFSVVQGQGEPGPRRRVRRYV